MDTSTSDVQRIFASLERRIRQPNRFFLGRPSASTAVKFHNTVLGAVSTGWRPTGDAFHPLFVTSVLEWGDGPMESDLMADGNSRGTFAGLDFGGLRMMGGGQDLEFHREITGEIELDMEVSLDSVDLKSGRSGEFIVARFLRRYLDEDDVLYTTCQETFIARGAEA